MVSALENVCAYTRYVKPVLIFWKVYERSYGKWYKKGSGVELEAKPSGVKFSWVTPGQCNSISVSILHLFMLQKPELKVDCLVGMLEQITSQF